MEPMAVNPSAAPSDVVVLGIFMADMVFRAPRLPVLGETLLSTQFSMGPGGKGSNQAVAAARAGASVRLITRLGATDAFGDMARALWAREGIQAAWVSGSIAAPTGAAFVFVQEGSGDNAILVAPGAATSLSEADVEANREVIEGAAVFMTQLEQPVAVARRGLEIARAAGVTTILNPAPFLALEADVFACCDYITPNETEAQALTGLPVRSLEEARLAGDVLLDRGVGAAVITLGAQGALLHRRESSLWIPPVPAGPVVDTTGAGDAFNGGLAAGLSRGLSPVDAAQLASMVAGLSVTKAGAAASMPTLREIERFRVTRPAADPGR